MCTEHWPKLLGILVRVSDTNQLIFPAEFEFVFRCCSFQVPTSIFEMLYILWVVANEMCSDLVRTQLQFCWMSMIPRCVTECHIEHLTNNGFWIFISWFYPNIYHVLNKQWRKLIKYFIHRTNVENGPLKSLIDAIKAGKIWMCKYCRHCDCDFSLSVKLLRSWKLIIK